jgi:menaquinone-dependent protoporphyrinogen oxidase
MPNILAVYGTAYGQTEKVIRRITADLTARGFSVVCLRADRLPASLRIDEFDGFVVGASVIRGRHQPYVERFVREHLDSLNAAPSAFLSVSGAAASTAPAELVAARGILQKFLDQTGWKPSASTIVAGGFPYTKYGFFVRFGMKIIGRKHGLSDFRRDYDFTDWHALDRFAEKFLASWGVAALPVPDRPAPWSEAPH